MRSRVVPVVLLVLALTTAAVAPAASPVVHREVLPNGIVLLVSERPAIPIVIVRVYTRAGAVLDPAGKEGLANLTGALLTRGTAKRTGPELDAAIEFVGGSVEAGAGRDGLAASLSVLRKDAALGFDLLAEVLLTPAFPEGQLKRKVAEIQAAIKRSQESPDTVASRELTKLVYAPHPYARPVEGTVETVGKLTRDDVVGFHRDFVRPDATTVAVVGAVTVAEARQHVLSRFGGWRAPATSAPVIPVATATSPPREERIHRELSQATLIFGRQAVRRQHPDYFPLVVANYILGGGSTGRLYARVREEGGLAYSVGGYLGRGKYGASAVVSAQTRTSEIKRVTDLIREEQARMGREPVTDRELDLARAYLVGSFPLRLDTSRKVADFIVDVEEHGLGLDYAERYIQGIRRVTAADVQRVAATYFKPDTFSLVIVGATGATGATK